MRSDAFKKAASEQARARPRKYATKQGKETKKKEHKNIYSVECTLALQTALSERAL
jgi:hypothetical protein